MGDTHKTERATSQPLDPAAAAQVIAHLYAEEPELPGYDLPGHEPLPVVPGYRLERRLALGGQGEVYVGWRDGSDRPFAIKLACTRWRDGQDASLVYRELDHLKTLRLSCLPIVDNYGAPDGRLFIAMEYIDGLAIDRFCGDRGLGVRERVQLLAKAAAAVHTLNDRGVIHRDLKPSHMLVTPAGDVMLIDLGIAKSLTHDTGATLTSDGQAIGTPDYMAPEQARGQQATIRSDVWALGAVGYVLLTGHRPRELGQSLAEALRQAAETPPRPPQTLNPSLPRDLAAILSKATAKRPDDRYSSAAELAADLERWLAGRPVVASPPTRWRRAMEWASRHPVAVTVAVCAAIAGSSLATTSVSVWWWNRQAFEITLPEIDPSYARLVARSGNILHEWGDAHDDRFAFGQLAERPAAMGAGKVAILGFGHGTQRELRAFDAQHPERQLWSSGTDPGREFMIPSRPGFIADPVFDVRHVQLVDVFPDLPGVEIVALHHHVERGAATLRVYDLAGNVLFEVWHFGWLYDAYWLSKPGVLVVVAVNSEALWRCRGHTDVGTEQPWPFVVMGIRPTMNRRDGWITTPDHPGTFESEWYRCLLPGAAYVEFASNQPQLIKPSGGKDPKQYVGLGFGSVILTLDSQGTPIAPPLVMASQRQQSNPAPGGRRVIEGVYLGDLPRIKPEAGEDCGPRGVPKP